MINVQWSFSYKQPDFSWVQKKEDDHQPAEGLEKELAMTQLEVEYDMILFSLRDIFEEEK